MSRHYYPRFDFASPAEYVNEHRAANDQVITSSVIVAEYLSDTGFVFLDRRDKRYKGQVCADGQSEKWTNLPLLSDPSQVEVAIRSAYPDRAWLVVDRSTSRRFLSVDYIKMELGLEERFTGRDGSFSVYSN
jgi:hypothetical protein